MPWIPFIFFSYLISIYYAIFSSSAMISKKSSLIPPVRMKYFFLWLHSTSYMCPGSVLILIWLLIILFIYISISVLPNIFKDSGTYHLWPVCIYYSHSIQNDVSQMDFMFQNTFRFKTKMSRKYGKLVHKYPIPP